MGTSLPDTRVHADRVDIDPGAVRSFFAGRAVRATGEHPLTSVLYQDEHPELAEQRDRHERSIAVPMLGLEPGHAVLDVGCGIGRWAESVLAVTDDYVGVDLTDELIAVARARYAATTARFLTLSADQVDLARLGREQGFDVILVVGLLLYLNDDDARRVLTALVGVAAPRCRVYLREPLAVDRRLTLRRHWSDELGQSYSAVYRTPAELDRLIVDTLGTAQFVPVGGGDLYPATLNNRAETRQRYVLLERR